MFFAPRYTVLHHRRYQKSEIAVTKTICILGNVGRVVNCFLFEIGENALFYWFLQLVSWWFFEDLGRSVEDRCFAQKKDLPP